MKFEIFSCVLLNSPQKLVCTMSYVNCLRKHPYRIVFPYANSILRASLEKGSPQKSLMDYRTLLHFSAFCPDYRTYALLLKACARCSDLYAAMEIHCHLTKVGLLSNQHLTPPLLKLYIAHDRMLEARELFWSMLEWSTDPFHGNLMLMGLLRSGQLDKAYQIFKRMPVKDLISWNSMIAGAVRSSHLKDAMNLFSRLVRSGLVPDGFSFSSVLSACAKAGARRYGVWVHQLMTELGVEMNHILSSALVDMYAKCGQLGIARMIFDSMLQRDVVAWNVMISGYGMHGEAKQALELFGEMERGSVKPNGVTFLAILSACCHSGFVEEGRKLFTRMGKYSLEPNLKHYASMVDLLGKSGHLQEAEDMVLAMPVEPDGGVWGTLLSACKVHDNFEMGLRIAQKAFASDPENDGYYILMSNSYGSAKKWDEIEKLREMMKNHGVEKGVGWSAVDNCG